MDAVADAADRDHARALDGQQVVQQQTRQREVAEVVGAELQLEAVFGGLPRRRVHHAGVVDQQVDARVGGAQLVGRRADAVQRATGRAAAPRRSAFGLAAMILSAAALPLSRLRTASTTCAPLAGEDRGGVVAEAGVGAGDDGDAARSDRARRRRSTCYHGAHYQADTTSCSDAMVTLVDPGEPAEPQGAAGVGDRRGDPVAGARGGPGGVVRRSTRGWPGCTPPRRR